MVDRAFGEAGAAVVLEELLKGEEASIFAVTDGQSIVTLDSAQDHKPAFDGDTGPNTGGMGAYSPAPLVTDEVLDQNFEQHTIRIWIMNHAASPLCAQRPCMPDHALVPTTGPRAPFAAPCGLD